MSDQPQAKITVSAEDQGVSQVLKIVEALEKKIADLEKQLKSYDNATKTATANSVKSWLDEENALNRAAVAESQAVIVRERSIRSIYDRSVRVNAGIQSFLNEEKALNLSAAAEIRAVIAKERATKATYERATRIDSEIQKFLSEEAALNKVAIAEQNVIVAKERAAKAVYDKTVRVNTEIQSFLNEELALNKVALAESNSIIAKERSISAIYARNIKIDDTLQKYFNEEAALIKLSNAESLAILKREQAAKAIYDRNTRVDESIRKYLNEQDALNKSIILENQAIASKSRMITALNSEQLSVTKLDAAYAKLQGKYGMIGPQQASYGAIGPVNQYGSGIMNGPQSPYGPKTQYGSTGPVSQYGTGGGQNGPYMFGFPTATQVDTTAKANAEYERLYGNTAKVAQAHKEASQAVEKHTSSWLQHIASVAGGIILYQGIRSAMGAVIGLMRESISTVANMENFQIQTAAMLTSNSKDTTNLAQAYAQNMRYAKDLIPYLMEVDIKSKLSFEGLQLMNREFTKQGMTLDLNSTKQKANFTALSNLIATFSTRGGDVLSNQIATETKAVLEGTNRQGSDASRYFASLVGGAENWKKLVAQWKQEGPDVLLDNLAKLAIGFKTAEKDIDASWTAVTSTFKSTKLLLEYDIFSPILKDWIVLIRQFNAWLVVHREEVKSNVINAWKKFYDVLVFTKDHFDAIVGVVKVLLTVMAFSKIMQIAAGFATLNGTLIGVKTTLLAIDTALGTGALVTTAATVGGIALAFAAVSVAIYLAVDALTAYLTKQGKINLEIEGMHVSGDNSQHRLMGKFGGTSVQQNVLDRIKSGDFNSAALSATDSGKATATEQNKPVPEVDKHALSLAMTRAAMIRKYTDQAQEEIRAFGKVTTESEADRKIDEINRALKDRKEGLAGLSKTEESELKFLWKKADISKRITAVAKGMYKGEDTPEQKLADMQTSLKVLSKTDPKFTDNQDGYIEQINKQRIAVEKHKNILYDDQKALTDQTALLGHTSIATARLTYEQQISNKAIAEGKTILVNGKTVLNEEATATVKQTMALYDQQQQLKDNIPLWVQMTDLTKTWGDSLASTLNDALYGSKITFASIGVSFEKMITNMIIQQKVMKPLLESIGLGNTSSGGENLFTKILGSGNSNPFGTGTGWTTSADSSYMTNPLLNAKGNIFMGGSVVPFATGGIVTKPTFFPMANGGTGLMGEAGDEAVMPLTRTSNGKLGVQSTGKNNSVPNIVLNITNNTGGEVKQTNTNTSYDGKDYIITTVLEAVSTNKNGSKDGLKAMLK